MEYDVDGEIRLPMSAFENLSDADQGPVLVGKSDALVGVC